MIEDTKYSAPCLKMIANDFPIFGRSFEVVGRMIATREFQGGFAKRYDIDFFFKQQAFQYTFVNTYAIMKNAAMDKLLYIIPLSKTLIAEDHVTFVMPHCKYNLETFIAKKPSKIDICDVYSQMCYALVELHEMGYVHRDLRPEHILVDVKPLRVRLCGFSSARLISTTIQDSPNKSGFFSPPWNYLDDGSVVRDIYAVAALAFWFEVGTQAWSSYRTYANMREAVVAWVQRRDIDASTSELFTKFLLCDHHSKMPDMRVLAKIMAKIKFTREF